MDEGKKPFDQFSREERDRYYGEVADFYEEANDIKEDMTLARQLEMLETTLVKILQKYLAMRVFDKDVVIVNNRYQMAAEVLVRKFRLNLAINPDFPANELLVVHPKDIETAIISRVEKAKGYVPNTILSGIKLHRG